MPTRTWVSLATVMDRLVSDMVVTFCSFFKRGRLAGHRAPPSLAFEWKGSGRGIFREEIDIPRAKVVSARHHALHGAAITLHRPTRGIGPRAIEVDRAAGRMGRRATEADRAAGRMGRRATEVDRAAGRMGRRATEVDRAARRLSRAMNSGRSSNDRARSPVDRARSTGERSRWSMNLGRSARDGHRSPMDRGRSSSDGAKPRTIDSLTTPRPGPDTADRCSRALASSDVLASTACSG